ncbi:hypothetical protein GTQ40_05730 [Flavobacteriaceae bacterium R38]|nr:hypothetical protein [Flavobacteriaceae bacterium R38]
MQTKNSNRRTFLNKLSKGLAIGTIGSMLVPAKVFANENTTNRANLYAMWAHGSEGKMEGVFHNGRDAKSVASRMMSKLRPLHKKGFLRSPQGQGLPGNSIYLGGAATATMIPTSAGAQFTVWDSGSKSKAKNGEFWVHYPISTPVIMNNNRLKPSKVLVKCTSTDIRFHISEIELWDANRQIFAQRGLKLWGPDKMHWFVPRNVRPVGYGLCVSIKVKAERVAADVVLEISGVGVDMVV